MKIVIKIRETFRETTRRAFRAIAAVTALFCLNLPNFAQTCVEKKAKICVTNVEVVIDNIPEKGISSQIFCMAKSALKAPEIEEAAFFNGFKENYSISIDLCERSFFKNIESAHSLYTHYQLFSDTGECVLENVFCSESRKSILSALTQRKQIERIAKEVKKYFAGGNKKDA